MYGENDYRPVFRALASGFARLAPTQLLSFHPRKALSMSYLARLMGTFEPDELLTRVPDQALLATSPSPPERLRSNYIAATRSGSGSIAMFYSASGRPIGVRLERLPFTTRFAFWFNPRSGQWHRDGGESHEARAFAADIKAGPDAGIREFAPPMSGDDADWVLVLAARESL